MICAAFPIPAHHQHLPVFLNKFPFRSSHAVRVYLKTPNVTGSEKFLR
ncbi:hypothetical protein [Oscillospiraceae bacterium]|nr:hypothetical protein [Oscillospiraceae bacterium]